MSTVHEIYVVCDQCGERLLGGKETIAKWIKTRMALRIAKSKGWRHVGGALKKGEYHRDYCPTCMKKGFQDEHMEKNKTTSL